MMWILFKEKMKFVKFVIKEIIIFLVIVGSLMLITRR